MNESTVSQYTLNDIEEGLKKSFRVNVTESMLNEFAKITGDYAPIHMDEEHANKTEFKHRICHGMLIASFFSRLVGMHLPGENGLLLSYSGKHLSPCYLNQEVIVEGIIIGKSESTRIITIKATIRDRSGKLLIDGLLKVLVLK
ncbi:MAG TPA: MaoC family dehydratase [Nitrososphaeraceae archaeon]|jgi:acyl dehydratase|nr:MaoC family dehydratase [Nitrososphaeraceae archaeon]